MMYNIVNTSVQQSTGPKAWQFLTEKQAPVSSLFSGQELLPSWGGGAALPASMLTTDRRIFSTLCTGLQRSALLS